MELQKAILLLGIQQKKYGFDGMCRWVRTFQDFFFQLLVPKKEN